MTELNVSNIQFFSIGDGPGIRSTIFLKGCNLRCPWCHNPETVSPYPQTLVYAGSGKTVSYGIRMKIDEIIEAVMQDADFYSSSGGGITISGGEPMLQAREVAELCKRLRELGIHTLIDTAGGVPWENFEEVLPYANCFFYDLKTPDERVCAEILGGDFHLIIGNLKRLVSSLADVHVRIPLIPGVNSDDDSLKKSEKLLASIGVKTVDLLPFHRMASSKYDAMESKYAFRDTEPLSEKRIEEIKSIFKENFSVTVER